MKSSNVFACTIFLIFLCFQITDAKNLYVDKNHSKASDSNAGTSSSYPLKTIQKAVDKAYAGDVVLVKYGVYYEDVVMRRSGNSSAPITIRAYDRNNRPIIDGSGVSATRLFYWGSTDRSYIVVDGFIIRDGRKWAVWISGHHNEIRNCDVYNFPGSGINVITGNYNVISGNKVYNIGDASKGWIGNNINIEADFDEGKSANYNIVENNEIYNNDSHFGVNIFPNAASSAKQGYMTGNIIRGNKINKCLGAIYTRYQKNFAIYNNVVTNSLDVGIWLHFHSRGPSSMKNFSAYGKIFNNTIVGNENYGILNATSNYLDVRNNLFYNNGRTESGGMAHLRMDRIYNHNINNNLYYGKGRWRWNGSIIRTFSDWKRISKKDTYSLNRDPKLKSVSGLDLSILSSSPAINAGANFGSPYNLDINGSARPKSGRFDIGAYEFGGTVAPTSSGSGSGSEIKIYAKDGRLSKYAGTRERYGSFGGDVLYLENKESTSDYEINVPKSGTYYVWGRFYYYSKTNSGPNSFRIQVDGGNRQIFGDYPAYKEFHWGGKDGEKEAASLGYLSAGKHKITVWGNEPGITVMLDMLVITDDPNYTPTDSDMKNAGKIAGEEIAPVEYNLSQNYPNPFNPTTKIKFSIAEDSQVSLKIFDILGAEVKTLVNEVKAPGVYEIDFNAASLPSGTYIYQIRTDNYVQSRKMILLK